MKYPFVSIISAVRNEDKYIGKLLDSLTNLDYPKDKYEIIIADGMSEDKTGEIIKSYEGVKLLDNLKQKTGPGRNIAIKSSKGEYVAITDGDCEVSPDWLKILVKKIQDSSEEVVAVGGPNLIFENDPPIARVVGYMQETMLGSGGSPQAKEITEEKEVYSIPNCNILYKKRIIQEEGLWDSSFDLGEDAELNFRLRKKGYKFIFLPNAKVFHHRRDSLPRLARGMFVYGREMAKVNLKHKTIARWYSLIPPLFVLFLLFSIISTIFFRNMLIGSIVIIILSTYILMLFYATFLVLRKMNLNLIGLLTLILLPIQHISYGLGFFLGLIK